MLFQKKYKVLSWLLIVSFLASSLVTTPITTASAAVIEPTILFQDDFSDGDYTSPLWTSSSGTWTVSTDPANSANQSLYQTDAGEGIIMAGDSSWTDYVVSMSFYTGAGGCYPGIAARAQDSLNYYYYQLQPGNKVIRMNKRINGSDTALASVNYTFSNNTWYTLKMAMIGSSIKCYLSVNGAERLLFDLTDSTYSSGKIGLRNKWQQLYVDDVIVTTIPPDNPTVVQSDSQTASSIALLWDDVEGATGYNIYRSTSSGSGYTYLGSSSSASYIDTGLIPGTDYYYKMAYSYGGVTESQWTSEYAFRTLEAPPGSPTGVSATALNSSEIKLNWSSVIKADGYNVYRAVSGSAISMVSGSTIDVETDSTIRAASGSALEPVTGGTLVYTGPDLTYTDSGLLPNTTYLYDVTAYNAAGESSVASVQSTTYMYDAPGNFTASSVTSTSVTLSWDAMAGTAVTYYITKSASKTGIYETVYSGADTAFTDNGLIQGTGYYYKAYAMIDGYVSAVSDVLSVGTVRTSFTPDTLMVDTNGNAIDAHGSGIMYDKNTGKYYWYGEYHVGKWPGSGVKVYSSKDLYNWTDEGMALSMIPSMEAFTSDPLISSVYAGRTDTAAIYESMRVGRIIERPKVIYNEKTKKYVMWMHMEGYTNADGTQNTSYGKAQAGVAISDSPIGPFEYIDDYRMDRCPADQTDYFPSSKGMARDMNLFQDEDGTAYIIYSSEENLTIYISKLTEDYLDITGWHKTNTGCDENGVPIRDTTYQSEYGVDYVRVFPNAQREAPALFKYNGKYYLLTSGATGWSANTNKVTVADDIFGTWSALTNPFVRTLATDPDPAKAFNSQTTCVIPVDAENGKFIYVGDDWNGGSFSNDAAKYIFLPIDFGQDSDMTIRWYSSWTLSALDYAAGIEVQTELPETYVTGETLDLPATLDVVMNGSTISTPVVWSVNSTALSGTITFTNPGLYSLQASLTELNNKTITYKLYSIPDHTIYFVNAGGMKTADYSLMTSYIQDTLLNTDVVDQGYSSSNANAWGYVGSSTGTAGSASGDIFTTLRYLNAGNSSTSTVGKDLTYKFTVDNGSYTVYTGFNDIWTNSTRKADLYINGTRKTQVTFISNVVYGYSVDVTDNQIEITVRNTAAQDPLINWIIITDNDDKVSDTSAGLKVSSGATLSWNKVIGTMIYKLYRSDSINGDYALVYSGSDASYTDLQLTEGKKYYYKVSSVDYYLVESDLSDAYAATRLPDTKTFAISATPFLLKGETLVNNMKLQWSSVTGATKYIVSRADNNGDYKVLQTMNGTSMDDYELTVGATYQYKVIAYNGDSVVDTAFTKACKAYEVPQNLMTYDNTTSSTLDILSKLKVGDTYYRFIYETQESGSAFKQIVQQTSADGITYGSDKIVLSSTEHSDLNDCKFESTTIVYHKNTNKFILWTHYENSSDYTLGRVAVAYAAPGESFTFIKSFQPLGNDSRDLGFFEDEDGSAYLISSAHTNTDTILYKLTDDWLDVEKKVMTIYDDQYREAPNMIKKDGIYYLFTSQAAGWYPSTSLYSSAPSLTGPWSELRNIGNTSTFSAQSGGLVNFIGAEEDHYVMMANRWMFGWKDATNAISQQRMLPVSFAEGYAFFDYYENVLYDGEAGCVIPVQNGRLLSQGKEAASSENTATAAYANDGSYETKWVATSSTSWPSTWTVDLGAACDLASLQISWYMVKGSEAYYQYTVEGSMDGVTYTTLIDKSSGYSDYGFTIDSLTGMSRYIKVTLVNAKLQNNPSNWYTPQMYEVKVFGTQVEVDAPVIVTLPENTGEMSYNDVVKVQITTATAGADIYYTLDGTDPDSTTNKYVQEFEIRNILDEGTTITLKAITEYATVKSPVTKKEIIFLPKPIPTVTPTATPIPTDKPTDIPTVSPTPTDIPTVSPTPTDAPTAIPTPTDTPTAAPTPTVTPTPSVAPTATPTLMPVTPTPIAVVFHADKDKVVADAKLLQQAADNHQDVCLKIEDKTGHELYSWSFDGEDLANHKVVLKDLDLSLSVSKVAEDAKLSELLAEQGKKAGATKGIVINFSHEGTLPAQASVRIYIGNLIEKSAFGSRIYLYHYNPDTKKLETLPYSSKYKVDKDGYITINIVHCSKYIVLPKEADKKIVAALKNQISVSPASKVLYVEGTKGKTAEITVTLPSTLELVASLSDKTGSSAVGAVTVSYKSLNKKIASVDGKGTITAVGVGTTTIITTIKLYSKKTFTYKTTITVKKP